jgi:two-component system response regulator LytT
MDILLIEDEKQVADQLCNYIQQVDSSIRIVAVLSSVEQSIEWLRSNTPDLIFMDINLSDGNCFEIFDSIIVQSPVVFSTAYTDFAIQAFEKNGIAYIMKPIEYSVIAQVFRKIYQLSKNISMLNQGRLIKEIRNLERKRFLVHFDNKLKSIDVDDVVYFYANERYVCLIDTNEQEYIIDYTLEYLEGVLPAKDFFRINRKFIISYKSIARMYSYGLGRIKIDLNIISIEDLLVSVDRTPKFRLWLDGLVL